MYEGGLDFEQGCVGDDDVGIHRGMWSSCVKFVRPETICEEDMVGVAQCGIFR